MAASYMRPQSEFSGWSDQELKELLDYNDHVAELAPPEYVKALREEQEWRAMEALNKCETDDQWTIQTAII